MSEYDHLPEFYVGEGGTRTSDPVYETTAPCQIMMTSAETDATGPTRVETGEHFISHTDPNFAWKPLNRAAGEKMQEWLDSLPVDGGKNPLTLEEITEASRAMRPREGEPDLDHKQWHAAVMRYAFAMRDKQNGGRGVPRPNPAISLTNQTRMPIMPFASQGQHRNDLEYGRGPAQHVPQLPEHGERRARRARVQPPMPGTNPAGSPQGTG